MGSGSSRGGRALKRLRGADSRPAGPGGAAPEGGTGPPASATAAAREEAPEAAEGAAGPAAPPDGRDETLRLLDQLLAESAAWVPGELAPRGPARPRPAAGAGSPVSLAGFFFGNTFPKPGLMKGGGALGGGMSVSEPPIEKVLRPLTNAQQPSQPSPGGPWAHSLPGKLRKGAVRVAPKQSAEDHPEGSSVSEAPGSCYERPERPSTITYDYSEEELMASIEQEYCC